MDLPCELAVTSDREFLVELTFVERRFGISKANHTIVHTLGDDILFRSTSLSTVWKGKISPIAKSG
jgi:hypothetical protein